MVRITERVSVADEELVWKAVRSGGPGGQHVNKVSTAMQLSFDIEASSLPAACKRRLLVLSHHQIVAGRVRIDVSEHRSQEQNREEALRRFVRLIRSALVVRKMRKATRPTRGAVRRRLEAKRQRAEKKSWRRPPRGE
jgi:ribosome-associated protein